MAFLLDPQQSHGLGDTFAKKLPQKSLLSQWPASLPVTPIDLDVWSLDQLLVLREWRDIDILLVDEDKSHQLVVIRENKIDSTEGAGQLKRYYERVQQDYLARLAGDASFFKLSGFSHYFTRFARLSAVGTWARPRMSVNSAVGVFHTSWSSS